MMAHLLTPGEPAPWFVAPVLDGKRDWVFSSAGGAPALLFFYGSAAIPATALVLERIMQHANLFDDVGARFFGFTVDPTDVEQGRIRQRLPGVRHFLDFDRAISHRFGATGPNEGDYRPHLLLLDTALHVVGVYRLDQVDAALEAIARGAGAPPQDWAPIIHVPNVLEPTLCDALIAHYDRQGGTPSGFMREVDGKTTTIIDPDFKRRCDALIDDPILCAALRTRIQARLVPAIRRSFAFEATRIERYIVAAYDAGAGHFAPHRDNTTKGTAHRRFAVTINLNADYDGGDLRFPEFGGRTYRAAPGAAVVFSCSMLHEATPVTRGRRYATLPFLYDDAAAAQREANNAFLDPSIGQYVKG